MGKTITAATGEASTANVDHDENMSTLTITDENITSTQEEFCIDTIVSHKVNGSKRHTHAKLGEVLYRVRLKGFGPSDDTWEPISNLTRSHVINYHHQNKLEIPPLLVQTIDD